MFIFQLCVIGLDVQYMQFSLKKHKSSSKLADVLCQTVKNDCYV